MVCRKNLFFIWFVLMFLHLPGCKVGNGSPDDPSQPSWSIDSHFEDKVSTYEDTDRDIWQKPDRVIDLLHPLAEKTVIDLGAGTGYFAFRLVQEAKKVIAIDIDPDFVQFMESKKKHLNAEDQAKFEVRLAKPDDPMIEKGEANALLVVNTYAYLTERIQYFSNIREKLQPQSTLVIIEFKMKNIPNGPPNEEKILMNTVEEELKAAGFTDILIDDTTLDYQYIVTAKSP